MRQHLRLDLDRLLLREELMRLDTDLFEPQVETTLHLPVLCILQPSRPLRWTHR